MGRLPERHDLAVGRALALAAACAITSACSFGETPPIGDLPPTVIKTLVIEGPGALDPGDTTQYRAILRYLPEPDLRTRDVTAEVQWSSSNPGVLAVDRGVAKALAAGVSTIEATLASDRSRTSRSITVGDPGAPRAAPTVASAPSR